MKIAKMIAVTLILGVVGIAGSVASPAVAAPLGESPTFGCSGTPYANIPFLCTGADYSTPCQCTSWAEGIGCYEYEQMECEYDTDRCPAETTGGWDCRQKVWVYFYTEGSCAGRECGQAPDCPEGVTCGTCPEGQVCVEGQCESESTRHAGYWKHGFLWPVMPHEVELPLLETLQDLLEGQYE